MTRKSVPRAPAALLELLGCAVTYAPRMVFAVSDPVAPFAFRGLDRQRLAHVFPEVSRDVARRADRWSRQVLMRNRAMTEAIRLYGYDERLRRMLLEQPLLRGIAPPAIITTFHLGALAMLGFGLEQLPAEVLVVRATEGGAPHASFERAVARVGEQQRALLFHRSVDFLRSGRFVFMAADPRPGGALRAPFRKGSIQLARGPFALSRITGAPIIPLVARWRGAKVELVVGEPVQPARDELGIAAALTSWLDRYLTAWPLEISEQTLSLMS